MDIYKHCSDKSDHQYTGCHTCHNDSYRFELRHRLHCIPLGPWGKHTCRRYKFGLKGTCCRTCRSYLCLFQGSGKPRRIPIDWWGRHTYRCHNVGLKGICCRTFRSCSCRFGCLYKLHHTIVLWGRSLHIFLKSTPRSLRTFCRTYHSCSCQFEGSSKFRHIRIDLGDRHTYRCCNFGL